MRLAFTFRPLPGLAGPVVVQPVWHEDARGWFQEVYKTSEFGRGGIPTHFVQENHSLSSQGVVRGLHYQLPPQEQGKLVRCTAGAIFDVAVDIRRGSPSFGQWAGLRLDPARRLMLWVPPGFAHGFQALENATEVVYLVTSEYTAALDRSVRFDDPAIRVAWPLPPALPSPKDLGAPLLAAAQLPEVSR